MKLQGRDFSTIHGRPVNGPSKITPGVGTPEPTAICPCRTSMDCEPVATEVHEGRHFSSFSGHFRKLLA